MKKNNIDKLYHMIKLNIEKIGDYADIDTFDIEKHYVNYFVVASASYFEEAVKSIIYEYVKRSTKQNKNLLNFMKSKILDRGYHGLASWNEKNPKISSFLNQFSIDWSAIVCFLDKEKYENAYKDFVYLGHQRNLSVHGNLSQYSSPYTLEDAYKRYQSANNFIKVLRIILGKSLNSKIYLS